MIEFLLQGSLRARFLAAVGFLVVAFQWWCIPFLSTEVTTRWLWAVEPSRGFPVWFQMAFPFFILLTPHRYWLEPLFKWLSRDPSPVLNVGLMTVIMVSLFWLLRIGTLVLGDAQLIMNSFVALNAYASVREPLESVLHTDFARFLFYTFGVHPQTSFQLFSCLLGGLVVILAGARLANWNREGESYLSWLWFLLLIAPAHLFFGYIEWYTQFVAGVILFEVCGVSKILTGRGLPMALAGLVLACCSHLVGFGFLPAGILLIGMSVPRGKRLKTLAIFILVSGLALGLTLLWIRRDIVFEYSVRNTVRLFSTLLPLMEEDNPANIPGTWHYAWLSANHLADLLNEIFLCALFPLLLWVGACPFKSLLKQTGSVLASPLQVFRGALPAPRSQAGADGAVHMECVSGDLLTKRLILFFLPQFLLGLGFLLLWDPWLGFPGDWDLFSFFAWPLLMAALVGVAAWCPDEERRRLLWVAGLPAFSVVGAWVVFFHQGSLPSSEEIQARIHGGLADVRLEEAKKAIESENWPLAFEKTERAMAEDPAKVPEALSLMGLDVVQRMSDKWPDNDRITRMACDMEIISTSPTRSLFVMDSWGRIFQTGEGGLFKAWSSRGIPGIPGHHAVAFEIAPWRKSAIILRDDGAMYELPIPSWVDQEPQSPPQTWFCEASPDHDPGPIGNIFSDYAQVSMRPPRMAVDLAVDPVNQRLVVVDNTGDLVTDKAGEGFKVEVKAPNVSIDVEIFREGKQAIIGDCFGKLVAWPGGELPVWVNYEFVWPAIVDFEVARGGEDVYVLDVQGGVFPFARHGSPFIDPVKMQHYAPDGKPELYTPYCSYALPFFSDLELVPGEKAYYRMLWNFRIYYGEQKE